MTLPLQLRHIQDHNQADATLQKHWGYPDRVLPCTKDEGTCEYLDAVYGMHDTSMLYTFILWGVILGILTCWITLRGWRMGGPKQRMGSLVDKLCDFLEVGRRKYLLKDAPWKILFGRVSRVQVAVLVCLSGYLLVFSLVGIVYKTWITPVKSSTLYNTRTGLGGFADRVGALAYALTPFTILLSSRESVLSMVTGIPYQHFNFFHRWLGRIIFIQAFLHSLGWTVVEGKLYQPQPTEYARLMSEQYIIFGVVAMFLLSFLFIFSCRWAIRWTGYEFFRVTHWLVALLYLGACWAHWSKLACWMIPSIALIFIDQGVRVLRILALHVRGRDGDGLTFRAAQAEMKLYGDGDDALIRLDFDFEHREAWQPGQHFWLTFPSLSIFQAHPFTPSSLPEPNSKIQHHTYLVRVRNGQTKQLAALAGTEKIPVILTGPYGKALPSFEAQNVLAIAGGTGVSFTMPITLATLHQRSVAQTAVSFVLIIRKARDLLWIATELAQLKDMLKHAPGLTISIFVTRECRDLIPDRMPPAIFTKEEIDVRVNSRAMSTSTQSFVQDLTTFDEPRFNVEFLQDHHPNLDEIVQAFMERCAGGPAEIVGSGPEAMGSDLRAAVSCATTREDLSLYWDSRE